MKDIKAQLLVALVASLTLGLAPFIPEPHLIGKIHWVIGGGVGMKTEDWFDLAMHGAPWLWLLGILVILGWRKLGLKEDSQTSN